MYFDMPWLWLHSDLEPHVWRRWTWLAKLALFMQLPHANVKRVLFWLTIKVVLTGLFYAVALVSLDLFRIHPLLLVAVDNKEAYLIPVAAATNFFAFMAVVVPRMLLLDYVAIEFGESLRESNGHTDPRSNEAFDSWLWRRLKQYQNGAWALLYLRGGSFTPIALLIYLGEPRSRVWKHNFYASVLYAACFYWFGSAIQPVVRLIADNPGPTMVVLCLVAIGFTVQTERRLMKAATKHQAA